MKKPAAAFCFLVWLSLIQSSFAVLDPATGRWLSRDPLNDAEVSQGPNLYAYVSNNPINAVDPLGLWQLSDCPPTVDGGSTFTSPPSTLDKVLARLEESWTGAKWMQEYEDWHGQRIVGGVHPVLEWTSLGGGGVKIVAQEANIIIATIKGARGESRIISEAFADGSTLILRGTHIEGMATLKESLSAAKAFGASQGFKSIVIEGGRRTTGANPGHIPKAFTIYTGL